MLEDYDTGSIVFMVVVYLLLNILGTFWMSRLQKTNGTSSVKNIGIFMTVIGWIGFSPLNAAYNGIAYGLNK